MQTAVATMENSMEFSQKIKNGPALWPSDSISRDLSEETQNTNLKQYVHPYVHCSIIYNSHAIEAIQVPINRGMDTTATAHIFYGILLGHKN